MGTNYYYFREICQHCRRGDDPIHIGKSSMGWAFGLHIDQFEGINCLDDWEQRFRVPGSVIKDEYGSEITVEEMMETILNRARDEKIGWTAQDYRMNHAVPDYKNNLIRHKIGRHCISHGEGTYDLMTGEFS